MKLNYKKRVKDMPVLFLSSILDRSSYIWILIYLGLIVNDRIRCGKTQNKHLPPCRWPRRRPASNSARAPCWICCWRPARIWRKRSRSWRISTAGCWLWPAVDRRLSMPRCWTTARTAIRIAYLRDNVRSLILSRHAEENFEISAFSKKNLIPRESYVNEGTEGKNGKIKSFESVPFSSFRPNTFPKSRYLNLPGF